MIELCTCAHCNSQLMPAANTVVRRTVTFHLSTEIFYPGPRRQVLRCISVLLTHAEPIREALTMRTKEVSKDR